MNNVKVLAAIALCMAYVAGIATGWAGYTLTGEHPPRPGEKDSWLSHTLQLTDEQRETMEAIWSPESSGRDGEDPRARIRAMYDERDNEVRNLLTEAQQAQFDAIYRTLEEKKDALSEERRVRHEEAIQKTMAILTPEQQKEYQKIVDDFEKRGSKRMRGPGDWRPDKDKHP